MRSRIIVTRADDATVAVSNPIAQTISELYQLLHTGDIQIDEEQGDNAILSVPQLEPLHRTMIEWALRGIAHRKQLGIEVSIV